MSRQQFSARNKIVQKMSRDGLVERDITAGEEKRISMRNVDFSLREHTQEQPSYSRRGDRAVRSKSKTKAIQKFQEFNRLKPDVTYPQIGEAVQYRDNTIHPSDFVIGDEPRYLTQNNESVAIPPDISEEFFPAESPHEALDSPQKLQMESSNQGRKLKMREVNTFRHDNRPALHHEHNKRQQHEALQNQEINMPQETASKHHASKPGIHKNPEIANQDNLQFTSETSVLSNETSVTDHKILKAEHQTEYPNTRLQKAQPNLPGIHKIASERVFDEKIGKAKQRIFYKKEAIPKAGHLKGRLNFRPVEAGVNTAVALGHRKAYQVEHENVGMQATHRAEMAIEGGARFAFKRHNVAKYRKITGAATASGKKASKLSFAKSSARNRNLKSNPASKAVQKRNIQRQYAKTARGAVKYANKAGVTVKTAVKAAVAIIRSNPAAIIILIIGILLFFGIMSIAGMFANIADSSFKGIIVASYLAENEDIDNAENAYAGWEMDLREQIENVEQDRPGFDEYIYEIDEIGHDPFKLLAYLTVMYQNFPFDAIAGELRALFDEQYTLDFEEIIEIRYYTNSDGDQVPYEWHILKTTLTVKRLDDIISERMVDDKSEHFTALMQTNGGRQFAGSPFAFDWTPYITSYYGWREDPFTGEREFHNGIDIGPSLGTPIIAAHDGVVSRAEWGTTGYGRQIVLQDKNGLSTRYAHCDALFVTAGQTVKQGDVIATVGSSGRSSGPHLHYEVMMNGQTLNPLFFAQTQQHTS